MINGYTSAWATPRGAVVGPGYGGAYLAAVGWLPGVRYMPGTRVAIVVAGTFVGTASVQVAYDGVNWKTVAEYTAPTPTASAEPKTYLISGFGDWLRIGCSAYTSGGMTLGLFGEVYA